MARRSYRPEQIIKKLGEAEVLLSQGFTVGEASRKIGVREQTHYRWRRRYDGMRIGKAKQPKELEPGRLVVQVGQGSRSRSTIFKPPL